jgi:hypothetical protein
MLDDIPVSELARDLTTSGTAGSGAQALRMIAT